MASQSTDAGNAHLGAWLGIGQSIVFAASKIFELFCGNSMARQLQALLPL